MSQEVLAVAERIEGLAPGPSGWLANDIDVAADPRSALNALEEWIAAAPKPSLYAEELLAQPVGRRRLIRLLGACGSVAKSLKQSPELGITVLEDELFERPLDPARIYQEGELLLRASRSYSHGLDRLRFLKQKWAAVIVSHDLEETWEQPQVWRALSDLADVVLRLAVPWVWRHIAPAGGPECPISIVAFGKHGGREVNYSSDIDVVYVLDDQADEATERRATRFCETFGRAIEDSMGRGNLYRVDLKLRPYGSAGPIINRLRAYRTYYDLYAEPWEIQALIRSRAITGALTRSGEWEAMRQQVVFGRPVSEFMLDQLVEMRGRIETHSSANDIKRGRGGIRDVEFIAQILQLAARVNPEDSDTLTIIGALAERSVLSVSDAQSLTDNYTWLRKLEHRLQFASDRQTHEVPTQPEALARIAFLMQFDTSDAFIQDWSRRRDSLAGMYQRLLPGVSVSERDQVLAEHPNLASWFDHLPTPESFYRQLVQNQDSMSRVLPIAKFAPRLLDTLRTSVAVTEAILSGEILEDQDPVPKGFEIEQLPLVFRDAYITQLARYAIGVCDAPIVPLSRLAEVAIQTAATAVNYRGAIIALGSLGREEMGPGSDADILLLVTDRQPEAEVRAQEMFRLLQNWRQRGLPLEVDSRLRPEGSKGLLVRTLVGFEHYAAQDMEHWERFALGNARLLFGGAEYLSTVLAAARIETDPHEALQELLAMKLRIENERVAVHLQTRNVKLGHGGLSDIEWTVRLLELMTRRSRLPSDPADLASRIRKLAREGALNAYESGSLQNALAFLINVRMRLVLAGFGEDLIPENPDKLDLLAEAFGFGDGNVFLAEFQMVTQLVRATFVDTVDRLRS